MDKPPHPRQKSHLPSLVYVTGRGGGSFCIAPSNQVQGVGMEASKSARLAETEMEEGGRRSLPTSHEHQRPRPLFTSARQGTSPKRVKRTKGESRREQVERKLLTRQEEGLTFCAHMPFESRIGRSY